MSIQAPILYPAVLIMCCLAVTPAAASACDGQLDIREATLASIKIFIQRQQKTGADLRWLFRSRVSVPGSNDGAGFTFS